MRAKEVRYDIHDAFGDRKPRLVRSEYTVTDRFAWREGKYGRERTHLSTFEALAKTPDEALDQYRRQCEEDVERHQARLTQAIEDRDRANAMRIVDGALVMR